MPHNEKNHNLPTTQGVPWRKNEAPSLRPVPREFFIGIDLGGKEKKTTGLCILENGKPVLLKDVFGKDVFKTINPYLKDSKPPTTLPAKGWGPTKVIAIDAPLTQGRGKGKMRLYEKFLSTGIFRKEKVNPIPPALMPGLCDFARELVKKLEKKGFVLDLNLIEVFPTLTRRISNYSQILKNVGILEEDLACQTENQKSALLCAVMAFLHSKFKTRYLGYKDGFLFLPEISFWKKKWQRKFSKAWRERPYLKYRYLITNIFDKT